MTPEQYATEYSQLLHSTTMLSKKEIQRKQAIEQIAKSNPIINEVIVQIEMDLLMSMADEQDYCVKPVSKDSLPDIISKLENDFLIANHYSNIEIERVRKSLEDLI